MSGNGKVFMLDDDHIFLELYQHFLESQGYEVFVTDNAYKFLLYGRELHPDVMFLDINMPRLNGWEVLSQITADEILQDVPVVMLSVNQDEDLAALKGVAHFLYKPLAIEPMTEILESYCQGNKNHDVLLIEDYEPSFQNTAKSLRPIEGCFCTHNLRAARKYLSKNQPKKIAVRYNPERFEAAKNELGREDVVRVDSFQELEKLLRP